MLGPLRQEKHKAPVVSSNHYQVAPNETKPDASTSTHNYGVVQQQQQKKAGIPQYHINGLELRWDLDYNIIPHYPIQVTGLKGTEESTVIVKDQPRLNELVKGVKQRRYADYLKENLLELVSITDGLGPWEKEWDEMYEECVGCEECEEDEEDEDVDMDMGTYVFIQVNVDSAIDAVVCSDDDDDAMDVDDKVGVKPCVGRQYVWQA